MNIHGSLVLSGDGPVEELSVSHTRVPTPKSTDIIVPIPVSGAEQDIQQTCTDAPPTSPPINIIVFGESGVGKSSVINMLMGEPVAAVSNQAVGCTYEINEFRATIAGQEVILHDTPGLNEAEAGTVPPEQAVHNLRSLAKKLGTVSLLMYCIRGIRFRKIVAINYNIFHDTIRGSDREVPVLLVITGLENEENMENWWKTNQADFVGMKFCGHACITATKGRLLKDGTGYTFQDQYDASKKKLKDLLAQHVSSSITLMVPPEDTSTPTPIRRARNSLIAIIFFLLRLLRATMDKIVRPIPRIIRASDDHAFAMLEAQNGDAK